jgi:hypothetical protein
MEYLFGVIVSLLVKYLKEKFGTDGKTTALLLIGISIASAGAYVLLVSIGYWETLAQILIVAGAFHNFIIRSFAQKSK